MSIQQPGLNAQNKTQVQPTNYIAGLGRGAIGFTTRSDIGPARFNSEPNPAALLGIAPSNYTAGVGRGAMPLNREDESHDAEMGDYSDAKYDEWSGYSGPLFSIGDYDEEDKEADEIYGMVDRHLDARRKSRREKKLKQELERMRAERPTIAAQFADLKRNLTTITAEEWEKIPDIGDYSIKKQKRDKYIPVPDNMIETARKDGEVTNSISTSESGLQTSLTNINDVGEARGTVLSLKLDKIADAGVIGRTVVDQKGYLTDLNALPMNNLDADIGDFKKARLLLMSVIQTNPKNSGGWVAAARVEELDGKLQAARNILGQGLLNCSDSEDLWLEAARLEKPEKSRAVLAKAVSTLPYSVKIWLAAANKENDKNMKSKVLRRSLEHIPNSEKLWKELIELEGEGEAKVLLHKAVECVPQSLELWLALAKLETYDAAKIVLNRARYALPTEPSIWVHAAKLEESQWKNQGLVDKVVQRGIKILERNGVQIKRDEWIMEAMLAERSGNFLTSNAIIRETIGHSLDEEDKERIWMEDAETFEQKGSVNTARTIYNHAIEYFNDRKSVFLKAIEFEKRHQKEGSSFLDDLLQKSVSTCPKDEVFWLMYAKKKWQNGDIEAAKAILLQASTTIPMNESIYLALAKLERQYDQVENARKWLNKAREKVSAIKVWLKSIKLEFNYGNLEQAWSLCEQSLKRFQGSEKLWILAGEIRAKQEQIEDARKIYERGVETLRVSVKLWMAYVHFEEELKNFPKARSLLEKARVRIPKNPELAYHSIKLEERAGNLKGAIFMLSKSLQENPKSGELWSLAIELEPKSTRKSKIVDALKQCENDPHVLVSVGKLFWKDRKYEKGKRWLERAVAINNNSGDAWAHLWKFVLEVEGTENANGIMDQCIEKEPREGRLWHSVRKAENGWRLTVKEILLKVGDIIMKDISKIE